MATSSDDLIPEIKQRIDILEIVSEYVKMRPAGSRHVGLCPFHSEKTGSFTVNSERGTWYCFGCGEGGDVLSFVQRIENCSFREALERLAKRAGIALPEHGHGTTSSERERLREIHEAACLFFEQCLPKSSRALAYLEKRGVSPELRRVFRIGYAPDAWDALRNALRRVKATEEELAKGGLLKRSENSRDGFDMFRDRLMFPICDEEGRVIAFGGRLLGEGQPKYLNSPETPLFVKHRILYGLHRALPGIRERKEALIMEGYMDVIAAHEFGFTNAVAPLGTALTENHLQRLRRLCDRMCLVFDADGAGMKAALRSLSLLEKMDIEARVVRLPEGADPDSLLRQEGPAAFARALADALPILDTRMEAILAMHDIRADAGYERAMREIAPLLAQVASDSWIHRLAEIRSTGAPERVAFHEEDIRRRLQRGASAGEAHSGGKTRGAVGRTEETAATKDEEKAGSSTLRKLYKAEEEILRASLDNPETAGLLLNRLASGIFLRPETRDLRGWMLDHLDEEWRPGEWMIDSPEVGALLGRLAATPEPILDAKALAQCERLLMLHREREQIRALAEGGSPSVEELHRIQEHYQRRHLGHGDKGNPTE